MNVRSLFRQHLFFYLFLGLSLIAAGCGGGSDSYDSPDTATNSPVGGSATNVLVEPATLKSWIDQGLVNSDDSFNDKVVIFDFGRYSMDPAVDAPRIKGACRVPKAQLDAPRVEGVALANPLVPTGEMIDDIIQRLAIDEETTIVFTSSTSPYYATRAYWIFRYWGFPQDQLKLLNGGDAAFAAEYPELMTREVPAPTPSTFSVRDLEGTQPDVRASVSEFIEIIKNFDSDTDVILDARGTTYYNGTKATSGLVGGDFVVVDGHPVGGGYLSQAELRDADGKYKSAAEIEALFRAKGWEPGKRVTVYCTSGYSATPLFFAVDAILGGDVQLHDGSWSQLGKYSDYAVAEGELPAGSPWAIDAYLDPSTVRYNYRHLTTTNAGYVIETVQLNEDAEAIAPFTANNPADDSDVNAAANQVEEADAAYVADGGTSVTFPAPAATATPEVLIDAATLQGWMSADLVNAPLGSERVVILDVTETEEYQKGHIPGAVFWDRVQHVEKRLEGPAPAVNMVVTGERMDQLIQNAGIDENTTIVITSSLGANYFPSRAYFLFRYYGFPKERIKVLNGYNKAWDPAQLVSVAPEVSASTLSVKDINNHQPDLRVALPELMDALRDNRGIPVDFRGEKYTAASTAGVYPDVAGDYVVFEGRLNNGLGYSFSNFTNSDGTFKTAAEIAADLDAEIGIDGSELVYSYCRTGYIASTGFFVLDGILGWDVMTYDGSWSQWGKMSDNADMGGELPEGSLWAVDNATYMDLSNFVYNKAATRMQTIEPLNADEDALALDPSDPAANQVENEDADYQSAGGSDDDDSGSAPTPVAPPAAGC